MEPGERIIDLQINPVVFEAVVAGAFGAALYVLGYYRGERHARRIFNGEAV